MTNARIFEIPNMDIITIPTPVVILTFLEAIPENSYFITADNLG
jgi:hypothetical protein